MSDHTSNDQLSPSPKEHWWLWTLEKDEIRKVGFMSGIFGCLVFTYSLLRPLKDTIFMGFVGAEYLPWARLILIAAVPIFLPAYSAASNSTKRSTATILFTLLYATICLIFAALFLHPVMGITNSLVSPWRFVGWVFYGCLDFYSVAVMATFWAMLNSISTPKSASKQYGFMVAVSKLSGALSAGMGWLMSRKLASSIAIPTELLLAALSLIVAAWLVYRMFKSLPQKYLVGYSEAHTHGKEDHRTGSLGGLKTIITQPYAFGIFWLLFSFEAVATLLDFRMQCSIAQQTANNIAGISSYLLGYTFIFQIVGFFLALFGTSGFLKWLGVRRTIMITPATILIFVVALLFFDNLVLVSCLLIAMRALEYSLETPVREILFIPTSRTIQFHAKGWIASFGKTLPKTSGSLFNGIMRVGSMCGQIARPVALVPVIISSIWCTVAYMTGKRYEAAIRHDELIG